MTIHQSSDGGPERSSHHKPLCGEDEFAQEVRGLVAEEAPRVFALVEEYGERVDGWIVAWGMAFEDCVEVVGVNGRHLRVASAERAQRAFSRRRTHPPGVDRSRPSARTGELIATAWLCVGADYYSRYVRSSSERHSYRLSGIFLCASGEVRK